MIIIPRFFRLNELKKQEEEEDTHPLLKINDRTPYPFQFNPLAFFNNLIFFCQGGGGYTEVKKKTVPNFIV